MVSLETIRIKLRRFYITKTAKIRRKRIKIENFTIISNNCWGGFIYQSYNLKYNTPTIGLFFMAEDYIEFLKDIKKWIYKPIQFINYQDSKYYNHFKKWNKFGKYPIGIFKDSNIEIHFLHYNSSNKAIDDWSRRVKRINWDKVIYKFNDQNLCKYIHIKRFDELPYENKICFTTKELNLKSVIHIKKASKFVEIPTSYEPFGFSKLININEIINKL